MGNFRIGRESLRVVSQSMNSQTDSFYHTPTEDRYYVVSSIDQEVSLDADAVLNFRLNIELRKIA